MKLLLDTQAFLLSATNEGSLSPRVESALLASSNTLYLSVVSLWEMQIKLSLGKLRLPMTLREAVEEGITELGLQILALEPGHIYRLADLPFHHKDPFDRLLAAQALVEGLTLVSGDRIFPRYGVRRLW